MFLFRAFFLIKHIWSIFLMILLHDRIHVLVLNLYTHILFDWILCHWENFQWIFDENNFFLRKYAREFYPLKSLLTFLFFIWQMKDKWRKNGSNSNWNQTTDGKHAVLRFELQRKQKSESIFQDIALKYEKNGKRHNARRTHTHKQLKA